MNNKGFTLIELLAVIVLLALISSVTIVTITSMYNNSKDKAEEVFRQELSSMIEDYITLNNSKFKLKRKDSCNSASGNVGYLNNNICYKSKEANEYNGDIYYYVTYKDNVKINGITKTSSNNIRLYDLIDSGIITEKDLINPKNQTKCSNINITVERNNDYKYCFKTSPANLDCLTKNKSINTCQCKE